MAYRDRTTSQRSGFFAFCIMEVRLRRKGAGADAKDDLRLLTVDTRFDTLQYVQDHMTQCVANIIRLKPPASQSQKG